MQAWGRDRWGGVCVRVSVCMSAEVCGKCGPESTCSPTLWGAEAYWGTEEGHARAGPASLCRPVREKHVRPTNQENTVHGPRWDLNLIHLTNQTTQGALEKTQHTPDLLGAAAV